MDKDDHIEINQGHVSLFENNSSWEVIEALGQGVTILDSDGRFTYVNPACAQMVGRSPEALIGLSTFDVTHPDDHKLLQQARQQCQEGHQSTYETRLVQPDNTIVYTLITGVPRWQGGKVVGTYTIITDLTEQKKATEALQNKQSQSAVIIDSAVDAIITVNDNQEVVLFNSAAEQMFGYTATEITGQPLSRLLPERFGEIHQEQVLRFKQISVTNRKTSNFDMLWALRANGQEFPIEASISQAKAGEQTLYTVILRDITTRQQAEQELRESEQKYVAIFDNLPFVMGLTKTLDSSFVNVNNAFLKKFEFTRAEVIGKTSLELGITSQQTQAQIRAELEAHGHVSDLEVIFMTKSGGQLAFELSINWVNISGGKHLLTAGRDITERKQALAALQESEEKLRLLIEHAPVALAMFDHEMHYLAVSRCWLTDYDLGEQNIIGHSHYAIFPEITDDWKAAHHRALEGEVVQADNDPFRRANGTIQWLRWEARPWYMGDGTIGGIVLFTEDITESNLAREAIHELQTILAEAQTVAKIGSWKMDLVSQKQTYSDELFTLFGLDRQSFDGDFIEMLKKTIHPDDFETVIQQNLALFSTQKPLPLEFRIVLPDGAVRIVWSEGRLTYDASGRPTALVGYVQDITERKLAERALRAREAQLRLILDTVPDGVLLLTAAGSIGMTNPVADKYLKILSPVLKDDRLIQLGNRPLTELLTSPPLGLWHEITNENLTFEIIVRPLEDSIEDAGWVFVLRDVTLERAIQQRAQQQERLAAVGQLAAGIAHDFNNIMTVVILYTQLILRTVEMPPRAQEKLTTIEQQAQRATDLIQQILDFSRQSIMEQQLLDLLPFMKELVKLLERTLPEDIQIELIHNQDTYIIQGDLSRIQQVIMNLAINARDAMPEGGRLQISLDHIKTEKMTQLFLRDMPPGNWVQIQVVDNGSGIPQKSLPRILEPFFTTKEVGKGTGLGLAQVLGIVQQHEGYLDVTTEVGQGTTFLIYLPSFITGEPHAAVLHEASLNLGQGQTILLVEDDPAIRQALLDSLGILNYEVVQAKNGREALTILETRAATIDLVLSDVVMPEMGGIALLHAMRQKKLTTPVILLTGHPLGREMDNLNALGLVGLLIKPPTLVSLNHLLVQALA